MHRPPNPGKPGQGGQAAQLARRLMEIGVPKEGVMSFAIEFLSDAKPQYSSINDECVEAASVAYASRLSKLDSDECTEIPSSFVPCEHVGPEREQITAHDPKLIGRIVRAFRAHHSCGIVPMSPPILLPIVSIFGLWRGLEGHNNSCYFDVLMMAMFAFNTCFDGIFSPEELSGATPDSVILLRMLADLVVRPLRERMFVPRSAFGAIRQHLSDVTRVADYVKHCLMDPSELLMHICENIPGGFNKICSYHSNTDVTTQIVITPTYTGGFEGITVQDLFNSHCYDTELVFSKPPNALFFQMRPDIVSPQWVPPSPVLTVLTVPIVQGLACDFTMDLCAITCIVNTHHVAFLRLPHRDANGMHVWVFYDSMRDMQKGHRVPLLFEVPGLGRYLETGDESDLPIKSDGEGRNDFARLIKEHAYLSLYCLRGDSRPVAVEARPAAVEARPAAVEARPPTVKPPSRSSFAGGGCAAEPKLADKDSQVCYFVGMLDHCSFLPSINESLLEGIENPLQLLSNITEKSEPKRILLSLRECVIPQSTTKQIHTIRANTRDMCRFRMVIGGFFRNPAEDPRDFFAIFAYYTEDNRFVYTGDDGTKWYLVTQSKRTEITEEKVISLWMIASCFFVKRRSIKLSSQ